MKIDELDISINKTQLFDNDEPHEPVYVLSADRKTQTDLLGLRERNEFKARLSFSELKFLSNRLIDYIAKHE